MIVPGDSNDGPKAKPDVGLANALMAAAIMHQQGRFASATQSDMSSDDFRQAAKVRGRKIIRDQNDERNAPEQGKEIAPGQRMMDPMLGPRGRDVRGI